MGEIFLWKSCRIRSLGMGLGVLLVFVLTAWSHAFAADYTLKLGHATANDAQDLTSIFFCKEVERLSKGKIKATVFNASQLGNNEKMNKDVRSGAQEAICQPTGFAAPYLKTLGVLDVPFLFPNDEVQTEVLNSLATEPFRKASRNAGLEIVAFFGGGFKNFVTRFPLAKAEDIQGRKFRVIQSPELVAQFKAFGAIGVPMPLGELYTGIQQGVVEGFEMPWDVTERMKLHEVAKNITNSSHGALSSVIMVNNRWLDSLPADLKEIVLQAGRNSAKEALNIYSEARKKSLSTLQKEATVKEFPEPEKAKLKTLSKQVWEEIRKDTEKAEALESLEKALASKR